MPALIFLVEDHAVVLDAYVSILALEPDLTVCGVSSTAEEALAALADGPCDLVVTDLRLPGMDGIDLTGRLLEVRPGLPVVVVTGHEEELFAERAAAVGASAFIPKSEAAATLVPTIRSVLAAAGRGPAAG